MTDLTTAANQHGREVLLRSDPALDAGLPLRLRSVGRRDATASFCSKEKRQAYFQLLWTVSGEGELVHGGTRLTLAPEWVMLLFPGVHRFYRSRGRAWRFRWLTIDGSLATPLFAGLGLQAVTVRRAGACPNADFRQLETEIAEWNEAGLRSACATAFRILLKATAPRSGGRSVSAVTAQALAAIEEHLEDPALGIDTLALRLGIHRSRLSRLFKQEVGRAPSMHIQRLRLRRAMHLLSDAGGRPVSAVASACGFADPDYFSRWFRRHTGKSPSAFHHEEPV